MHRCRRAYCFFTITAAFLGTLSLTCTSPHLFSLLRVAMAASPWRHLLLCFALLFWGSCVANDQLTVLPPRGWNSYDSFSWTIDEPAFLHNAQILAEKLLPHRYQYAVIDFLWYRKNVDGAGENSYGFDNIDQWGRPFPDPKRFPSSKGGKGFRQIADKVHEMDLKFGIHLMNGISTQAVNASTPILDIDTVLIFV